MNFRFKFVIKVTVGVAAVDGLSNAVILMKYLLTHVTVDGVGGILTFEMTPARVCEAGGCEILSRFPVGLLLLQ